MSERTGAAAGPPSQIALHHALQDIWVNPSGIRGITSVNHSIIGRRFILTGFFFFLVGGILAMLIRAQIATSGNAFLDHDTYNQIFTMHGTVMMFLFAIPVLEGFAFYLLPKMLGARDLAFPRLSSFGYWCYLFGGMILLAAMAFGFAPDGGWFMYTPLSGSAYTPGINADVWLIGVTFVEISAMCAGIELVATILKVRTAGMSLARMPLFAWYILVTAFMILVGFPPLILGSIILEIERAFDLPFFDVARGGDPLLWQHLFWLFGHPEVYIIFLPAAGMVSTLIPVFARHPAVGYTAIVASVIATGFISFGLWVHHMFTVGIPHLALVFFSAASMLVAIPTALQFFAWIATLFAGRPVLRLPMLYLFGFLFVFVAGGLTGVMLALVPFNWQAHDTHFVVAHLHYVLVGGLVFPLLAAAYYWLPHFTGRMPSERLGQWAFWLIFIGFNMTFFLMHVTGLMGMPRRIYTYRPEFGWDTLNLISSIGGFVMSAGFALFILDLVVHTRFGREAPRDPWKAGTLDWAMPTPPPIYNFASLPPVDDRDPLWRDPDLPGRVAAGRHLLAIPRNGWQETLAVEPVSGRPDYFVILPRPSWLPFLGAVAMGAFFLAFLAGFYRSSLIGLAAALVVFLVWAWANGMKEDAAPMPAGEGLELLPHPAAAHPPGWWGTVFTLVANGTFLASLLYGFYFLRVVAPEWPPEEFVSTHPLVPALAFLGLLTGALSLARARIANAAGHAGRRAAWLALAVAGGLVAAVGFAAIPVTGLSSLTAHAYAATVTVMAGYGAFHCGLGALMAAFALARCGAGYVSAQRRQEIEIVWLWWAYTAGAGVLLLVSIYAAGGG